MGRPEFDDSSFIGDDSSDGPEYLGTMEFTGETESSEHTTLVHESKSDDD